jgi:HD-GYP domain-containing protein (c-di-GMP phosphodiesterase class II)
VAIADAFDAMTSDRPYRKKLSAKEAMYVLKEGERASFDPDLVDMFTRVLSGVIYNNEHGK